MQVLFLSIPSTIFYSKLKFFFSQRLPKRCCSEHKQKTIYYKVIYFSIHRHFGFLARTIIFEEKYFFFQSFASKIKSFASKKKKVFGLKKKSFCFKKKKFSLQKKKKRFCFKGRKEERNHLPLKAWPVLSFFFFFLTRNKNFVLK